MHPVAQPRRRGPIRAYGGPLLLAILLVGFGEYGRAAGVEWGYSGSTGPEYWGQDFTMCGAGRNQSPVDIEGGRTLDLGSLVTGQETIGERPAGFLTIDHDYQDVPLSVLNNGHSIEVRYPPGSTMTVHGRSRALQQFHFHGPSENRVDGGSFPLEAHLVHADDEKNLTVIGILFTEGESNGFLETLWSHMPTEIGKAVTPENTVINVSDLFPEDLRYYYFNGSLTTPPCSEGVAWLLIKEPVEASKEQIEQFRSTMGFENNRPIQPINTRVILTW